MVGEERRGGPPAHHTATGATGAVAAAAAARSHSHSVGGRERECVSVTVRKKEERRGEERGKPEGGLVLKLNIWVEIRVLQ